MGFGQRFLDWLGSPAISFDGDAEEYWQAIAARDRAQHPEVHHDTHQHVHLHPRGFTTLEEEIEWHQQELQRLQHPR